MDEHQQPEKKQQFLFCDIVLFITLIHLLKISICFFSDLEWHKQNCIFSLELQVWVCFWENLVYPVDSGENDHYC